MLLQNLALHFCTLLLLLGFTFVVIVSCCCVRKCCFKKSSSKRSRSAPQTPTATAVSYPVSTSSHGHVDRLFTICVAIFYFIIFIPIAGYKSTCTPKSLCCTTYFSLNTESPCVCRTHNYLPWAISRCYTSPTRSTAESCHRVLKNYSHAHMFLNKFLRAPVHTGPKEISC